MDDVVFRRIRGRIVAIKKRVEKSNGPSLVAAGIGISAGAGYVGAKVTTLGAKVAQPHFDKASHYLKIAKVQKELFGTASEGAIKQGFAASQKFKSITQGSLSLGKKVVARGKMVGISLAGLGIGKIIGSALPESEDGKNSIARDVATNSVGMAVAFAGNSVWKKVLKKHFMNSSIRGINFAARNAKATAHAVRKML
jgi:hypothetical protein